MAGASVGLLPGLRSGAVHDFCQVAGGELGMADVKQAQQPALKYGGQDDAAQRHARDAQVRTD